MKDLKIHTKADNVSKTGKKNETGTSQKKNRVGRQSSSEQMGDSQVQKPSDHRFHPYVRVDNVNGNPASDTGNSRQQAVDGFVSKKFDLVSAGALASMSDKMGIPPDVLSKSIEEFEQLKLKNADALEPNDLVKGANGEGSQSGWSVSKAVGDYWTKCMGESYEAARKLASEVFKGVKPTLQDIQRHPMRYISLAVVMGSMALSGVEGAPIAALEKRGNDRPENCYPDLFTDCYGKGNDPHEYQHCQCDKWAWGAPGSVGVEVAGSLVVLGVAACCWYRSKPRPSEGGRSENANGPSLAAVCCGVCCGVLGAGSGGVPNL